MLCHNSQKTNTSRVHYAGISANAIGDFHYRLFWQTFEPNKYSHWAKSGAP